MEHNSGRAFCINGLRPNAVTPRKHQIELNRTRSASSAHEDNGLSGKKLVIDHYGPSIPIGGGALCGKDAWKVDRCGPLRARQPKSLPTIKAKPEATNARCA